MPSQDLAGAGGARALHADGHATPSERRSPLLQVVHALYPQAVGGVEIYAWGVAQALGGAVLSLTPRPESAQEEPAWSGLQVLTPRAGEGALAAWHRALDAVRPGAVFIQHLGAVSPALLLDLRERGIPYAVFLHDFTPLCPTRRLWHRRQERCSGPGRTGWKCAWCVSGTARRAVELPLRTLLYRHRPQDWRTALVRADVLVASSRFVRDFWIEQGAPPERIAVIAPRLPSLPLTAPPHAPAAPHTPPRLLYAGGWGQAAGAELLAAALDQIRRPVQLEVAGLLNPESQALFRDAVAARHPLVFHGAVPHDALPELVCTCDAVAIPSRWDQPDSRLAAEAQLVGGRVVATAIGGLTEAIIYGVNGYLAAPDDPAAFAEALQEAFEPDSAAWAGDRVRDNAGAEATAARTRLQRLLQLLLRDPVEPDPALALDHGAWLAADAAANGLAPTQSAQKLIAALRLAGIDADPPPADRRFAARARALSRRRRVALNHAIAFFRACGCSRIAHLSPVDEPALEDAAAWFGAWGLESVGASELPDGIFFEDAGEAGLANSTLLRRRFPQGRALVVVTPAGVETQGWPSD